jgi:lipooligosaccharide transport system permease protein
VSISVTVVGSRRALRVVERNSRVYARGWMVFLATFAEPFLLLFSLGVGLGGLVGTVPGPNGTEIDYQQFVAPALIAVAAMNGTILETTFQFYFKYRYAHTYDSMMVTPIGVPDIVRGELAWAVIRGTLGTTAFFLVVWAMGLSPSPWGVLAVPASVLIAFGFAGAGLGLTTYMRSFMDFDYVQVAIVPLFLFSGTFFPVDEYPPVLGWIVRASPLYQGVAIERALLLGAVTPVIVLQAAYLVAMGVGGMRIASRRLRPMLQP